MSRFYVAALPRSGTAWTSVLLTTPHSFCLHEAVKWGDPESAMARRPEPMAGTACTGLPLYYNQLTPGPVAVIWRDPEDVKAALERTSAPEIADLVDRAIPALESMAADADVVVPFTELFTDPETPARLQRTLLGEADPERIAQLQWLRVETDLEREANQWL